ncbi:coniferyl aldehyde dehydrogenase [Thiomonas sp. FB-Cd]|uniref:coniferyl aldehyde dehydrogenase n=1 Tax=Thiomonas sp. FB-Cd TaxID=1158292 RepID=UPI0004DFBF55|nr:coniferyl aldehyde dehydrogenase [Thiomonas sp. FB-Cd]
MDRPPLFSSDLQAAYEHLHAASRAEPYPAWSIRRDRLRRLAALIRANETLLCQAISDDFGHRSAAETQVLDVVPSLEAIRHALRHGASWMRPRRASTSIWFWPARAQLLPQPLGLVGIIAPWNYPLYLAVGPLASAFAAGNRAMVKLSEFSPAFGAQFSRLVRAAFDPAELVIFTGGADEAAAFSSLPFDHLLFTGSTAVGKRVMAAASANLVPVTLELGGKSPAVLTPEFDVQLAADRIVYGKLVNAGQTCVAPDYVLLPRNALEAFATACERAARRLYPQGLRSPDYCSIIDMRHYSRLTALQAHAHAAGVKLHPLFAGTQHMDLQHRLAPVLFIDPPDDIALMQDEIFGPWLPLVPYDNVEQAITYINARPRPLALYWFDRDKRRIGQALRATHAGGVTVNDTLFHVAQDDLPFGGIGPSGMGQYHGRLGFETFTKLKPVLYQPRLAGTALVRPPYGKAFARLIAMMKR